MNDMSLSYTPQQSFGLVIPVANEAAELDSFAQAIATVFAAMGEGIAYLVVDKASKDNTLDVCRALSARDPHFVTVWAPENRNVVDAYLRGYREALAAGHPWIVEMDAGFSHDPATLPLMVAPLKSGVDCTFGSRFVPGGGIADSNWKRTLLSRGGTVLSNGLLGTRLRDMTSGYQGFRASVVRQFLEYGLRSRAHFYQTELRYLSRNLLQVEIPIRYRAPSPSVSRKAIVNSFATLGFYLAQRLRGKAPEFR